MKQRILHSFRLRAVMLVAMMLCVINAAWAQTTVTWSGTTALPGTATAVAEDPNVTIKTSSTNTYTNPIRIYAKTTITIQAAEGFKIESVTYEASSTGNYVTYAQNATVTPEVTPTVSNKNVTWSFTSGTTEFTFTPSSQTRANSITITYSTSGGGTPSVQTVATPTFSPAAGTYTSAQNVTLSTTTDGATIYYTTDGTTPTTSSNAYSTAIPVSSTTTIKAIAVKEGMNNSSVAEAAYTILSIEHAGTEADPYTVADARAAIDANTGLTGVYVAGIVCTGGASLNNGALNYWISDDGTETNKFEIYKGKGIGNADFTSTDDIQVDDVVVVYGNITKYNSTYEFSSGSQLVSLDRPVTPSITADNVEIEYNATSSTINFTVNNETQDGVLTAAITAGNEGSWLSLGAVETASVPLTCSANEGNTDRTATITLTYTYNTNETVKKDVTITQSHFVVDYATLPFAWAGGAKSALVAVTGVTASGLGSDYAESNAPYRVKMDGEGDYILIKTDGQPGVVSVGVKMIGGATTSKIKVQQSADGTNFTDVEELTISGSQNDVVELETTNAFNSASRYVKIIKSVHGSNIGVGPISIAVPSSNPEIIADASVELIAEATSGEIAYSINNPDGVTSLEATSDDAWISNITVTATKVTFTTSVNTGAARVGTITLTYGSLTKDVTVTQAEHVDINTYTLATTITSGKHYVIVNREASKAMGKQNSNNRAAVDITIDGNTATVASNAGIAEFRIYGPDYNKYYCLYDDNNDDDDRGFLYAPSSSDNYLRTHPSIEESGYWVISIGEGSVASIVAKGEDLRNVMQYNSSYNLFSCYGSASQQPVYLYEKDGEAATAPASVNLNANGYATFASTSPVDFTDAETTGGYTAWAVTGISGTEVTFTQIENAVEEGTGVFLKGTESSSITPYYNYAGLPVDGNKLVGITTATDVTDGEYFGLKGNEFRPVNAGTIPAGKALLPASALDNSVKAFTFVFVNTATGVRTVETVSAEEAQEIFNLAGQRVNKASKGIFIQNGKKVVVK